MRVAGGRRRKNLAARDTYGCEMGTPPHRVRHKTAGETMSMHQVHRRRRGLLDLAFSLYQEMLTSARQIVPNLRERRVG